MSIKALCSVHQVYVLTQSATTGASMGVKRVYSSQRPLSCRMVPQTASAAPQLGQQGQIITHQMWTATDPQLTEQNRILWNGTILRVSGIPTNPHGQGRFWITNLVARTEDNAVPTEIG